MNELVSPRTTGHLIKKSGHYLCTEYMLRCPELHFFMSVQWWNKKLPPVIERHLCSTAIMFFFLHSCTKRIVFALLSADITYVDLCGTLSRQAHKLSQLNHRNEISAVKNHQKCLTTSNYDANCVQLLDLCVKNGWSSKLRISIFHK